MEWKGPDTATARTSLDTCRSRRKRTRWWWWRRRRSQVDDAHIPTNDLERLEHLSTRNDALCLECLLIHHHHFLPRYALED